MNAELATEASETEALQDSLVSLMRAFNRARTKLVPVATADIEWSAQLLLRCIAGHGAPMRAAEIAEGLQFDPSTVSRQVAALVKDGHLERRADPADGRASLLALTPRARRLLAEQEQLRREHFTHVLDGWSRADIERFAALLQKFTHDYEATTTDWIATRSRRAGSTH